MCSSSFIFVTHCFLLMMSFRLPTRTDCDRSSPTEFSPLTPSDVYDIFFSLPKNASSLSFRDRTKDSAKIGVVIAFSLRYRSTAVFSATRAAFRLKKELQSILTFCRSSVIRNPPTSVLSAVAMPHRRTHEPGRYTPHPPCTRERQTKAVSSCC